MTMADGNRDQYGEETRQLQMVCLDQLIAGDDVLRRIKRLVDWELVRETARPFYSDFDVGRQLIWWCW